MTIDNLYINTLPINLTVINRSVGSTLFMQNKKSIGLSKINKSLMIDFNK